MGWEEGKGEGKMLSIRLLRCFLLGSLSCDVFKRRTSTLSGLATLLSRDFEEMFEQIVSIRAKKVSHTNEVASWYFKREKGSLPFDVRRSKTWQLIALRFILNVELFRQRGGSSVKFKRTQFKNFCRK